MAQNTVLFQNAANTKNTRPPRLGAPLRYGPRHYMSACAASLRSVAPGSIFFFYATRGSAATPLHRRAIVWRPSGAPNSARLGGSVIGIEGIEGILRLGIALVSRFADEAEGFRVILRHAITAIIANA